MCLEGQCKQDLCWYNIIINLLMVFVEIIEVYYCNLYFYNVVYIKLAVFDTLVYKCTLAMETACM